MIRVDNTTGVVDVVPVYAGHSGMPEAVTRYLLTHYVTVCERFNFATAESDYEECGSFHTAQRNQAWYALWNPTNPASPLNIYKDGTTVRAQVTSVSFFKRASGVGDLAQVRYVKAKRAGRQCDGGDDALDRDAPVRLRRSLSRPQGAGLESARVQDRRFQARAGSADRTHRAATALAAAPAHRSPEGDGSVRSLMFLLLMGLAVGADAESIPCSRAPRCADPRRAL